MKLLCYIFILCMGFLGCVTSKTSPIAENGNTLIQTMNDTAAVTIFLLERDIPAQINRLGVVMISPRFKGSNLATTDTRVKTELRKVCQKLGANGAFRTLDGTYEPNIVSYMVFHYDKSSPIIGE